MNNKFNVGDRVQTKRYGNGVIKSVPDMADDKWAARYFYAVELERNEFGHECGGLTAQDRGYWAEEEVLTLIPSAPVKPKRTFTPSSQNGMILAHLLSGGALTRVTADHLYRVASLTRRIRDLRDAGHKIIATTKEDHTGRPYVEYTMRVNKGR